MSSTPFALQSIYNPNKFSTPNSLFSTDTVKSPIGSSYLPGYLLGNANYTSSPVYGRSLGTASCPSSPVYGRSLSSGYQNHSPTKMHSKSPPSRQSGYPYTSPIERKMKRMSSNNSSQDGAPPTESLYASNDFLSNSVNEVETLKRNVLNNANESLFTSNHISKMSLNNSIFSPRAEAIPQSPAQIDPFYSQGAAISSTDVLDDTAVTVFGFPPSGSSFILQQFAQYGTVEQHEIHNSGNWLHLKYQTKIQAKKALSKNGKIFARTIMIGVCPCIKKEISKMETEICSSTVGTPLIFPKKKKTMHSLSSTNTLLRNTSAASLSMTNDKTTPKKRDSLLGKSLDYIFGW